MRLQVDGQLIEARPGDSVLVALLRAGLHPAGGGCLCLGGDCPHCLTTVNGVAYTRSCQVKAEDGMVVRRDHAGGEPPPLLPDPGGGGGQGDVVRPAPVRHIHCDVVVIGQGDSGRRAAADARAAGEDVVTLDDREGQHVTGVYPGPLVVAADDAGRVLHVHPRREIVVATGAAEIQPVVSGSDLEGLLTVRAAIGLAAAGIDLGRVVSLGTAPPDLPAGIHSRHIPLHDGGVRNRAGGEGGWDLVRFEGRRRLEAVMVRARDDPEAPERRIECDTAVLDLGRQPRTALARMASDLPVRVVGSAAVEAELPRCPREGTVCPCSGVTVADLDDVWQRGFREMELVKRATLAGTGACQGGVCLPYLRSFLLDRGGRLQPSFTARPLNRQLTVRELAAGAHTAATPRSPLHDEHLRLGARMDRAGGWWRPWVYGQERDEDGEHGEDGEDDEHREHGEDNQHGEDDEYTDEYAAVRNAVSLGDVSSLGKMVIAGPDAEAFLERIVPTRVSTLGPGRCRHVLMLNERGAVFDDGVLCRTSSGTTRFFFTSTSGGSSFFELWLRDWAEAFGFDVRILNQTASLAAIHVTGPEAARLLARAGARKLPGFCRHQRLRIAGIDCRVLRLSFTGELSYELHHAAADAERLWRRLLAAGGDLNVRPHGLKALLHLRLEEGHIVVGQDTDYDSTPRRLGCEWAVDMTKGDFIGRQAIVRTNKQPPDRRLVALEMPGASLRKPCHPLRPRPERRDTGAEVGPASRRIARQPTGHGEATVEGEAIHHRGRYVGYITSAGGPEPERGGPGAEGADSEGASAEGAEAETRIAMLGWLDLDDEGNLPRQLTVGGQPARHVDGPLYDPDGKRARVQVDLGSEPPEEVGRFPAEPLRATDLTSEPPGEVRRFPAEHLEATDAASETPSGGPPRLRPLEATRVAAAPEALDDLVARPPWPANALALRIAADELLVTALPDFEVAGDPHAIVERETGFSWVWLTAADATTLLDRECDWEPQRHRRRDRRSRGPGAQPTTRPTLAQGGVAGVPVKIWFETGRTLLLTPAPLAAAFQRRLGRALGHDAGRDAGGTA